MLTNPEKRAVSELTRSGCTIYAQFCVVHKTQYFIVCLLSPSMFSMQKKGEYEPICPIMEFMNNVEHTVCCLYVLLGCHNANYNIYTIGIAVYMYCIVYWLAYLNLCLYIFLVFWLHIHLLSPYIGYP